MKLLELVASPPGEIAAMVPDVAPVGTVAVIEVEELTVKEAVVPLNVSDDAEVKPVPVIVTDDPMAPDAGEKLVIAGAAAPSTFALSTAAVLAGTAEKNVNPVSVWSWLAEVT